MAKILLYQTDFRKLDFNILSLGASRSNNMRDPSYGLLRSSLELMLILNTSDTMQYGNDSSRLSEVG